MAGPKRSPIQTEPKIFVLSLTPAKVATGFGMLFFAKQAATSPIVIAE